MRLAFRVVFVCSGNTCRSPMAAALLKDRVARDPLLGKMAIDVRSAGLDASPGAPAAQGAIGALGTLDISLAGHKATRFGKEHLEFDLILTMTEGHKSKILLMYPEVAANVYTLKEYAGLGGPPDIADPFMQGDEVYLASMKEIESAVDAVVDRLKRRLAEMDEEKRGE